MGGEGGQGDLMPGDDHASIPSSDVPSSARATQIALSPLAVMPAVIVRQRKAWRRVDGGGFIYFEGKSTLPSHK